MKFISSQLTLFIHQRGMKRNLGHLFRFVAMLLSMVALYTVLFHYIMQLEGREFSWITGVYWTLTVMSTLGFGDITFVSDLGRFFSIVVLLSGVIFLLVMLPFTFIQYFYAPWLEAQKRGLIPRSLPPETKNHVIVVGTGSLPLNLMDALAAYEVKCVLLCSDSQTTLDMVDQGYKAVMGDYDDGEVYRRLQVHNAAMLVALDSDVRNTSTCFTARQVSPDLPITARVEHDESIDILELAGCTHVVQFHTLLGKALARRVLHHSSRVGILNRQGELVLAEAPVMRTSLEGKSLLQSNLRRNTGINLVGVWERGHFKLPNLNTVFSAQTVLVAAGTDGQMKALNNLLGDKDQGSTSVVILGGGRVGLAAAKKLQERQVPCVVVDKAHHSESNTHGIKFIQGDAADLATLEQAGIRTASSVIITTHDDDTNVYLTIYCRRLRPDIQVISRATVDRNVSILHAAGADLVLSLISMITNTVLNLLTPGQVFMLNEGLTMFRSEVGEELVGKALKESGIRDHANCSVVAVRSAHGQLQVNPEPDYAFQTGDELYLIGDTHSEQAYHNRYGGGTLRLDVVPATQGQSHNPSRVKKN